jgi:hypothetical protein
MPTTYVVEAPFGNRCALCSQIAGDPAGDVIHQLLGAKTYERRVIDLTADLSLVPSLGSLTELHMLLCPKQHSRRMIDAIEPNEFQEALNRIGQLLGSGNDSGLVLFEHGASQNKPEVPCSVEHAHLHIVGIPQTSHVTLPSVQWTQVPAGITAVREVLDHREYLLWSDNQRGTLVTQENGEPFPSQVLRRAVAHALGTGEHWNWRECPDAISADAMYRRIAKALATGSLA